MLPVKKITFNIDNYIIDEFDIEKKIYYLYIKENIFNLKREDLVLQADWVSKEFYFFEALYQLYKEKKGLDFLNFDDLLYLRHDWNDIIEVSYNDIVKFSNNDFLLKISFFIHNKLIKILK